MNARRTCLVLKERVQLRVGHSSPFLLRARQTQRSIIRQASEVARFDDLGRVYRRAPATIEVVFDEEPYRRPGRRGLARCLRLEYKGLDRHAVAKFPHGERVPKVRANL